MLKGLMKMIKEGGGEMRMSDIERKARNAGIKNTWRFSKKELIKAIQRAEGNFDCFGTASNNCSQAACCWKSDCLC